MFTIYARLCSAANTLLGPRARNNALAWFIRAAESGYVGKIPGSNAIDAKTKDCLHFVARAVNAEADAFYQAGECYVCGHLGRSYPGKAARWFSRAIDAGTDGYLLLQLGMRFANGDC